MKDFRSQFRIPQPLADRLKQASEQNHRSLNAELVDRLERSFPKPAGKSGDTVTIRCESGAVTLEMDRDFLDRLRQADDT